MKIIEIDSITEIDAKQIEIAQKIEAYRAAQAHQLEHGGPGPVADYDVMSIVNEHNGEFQVVVKERPQEEPVQE